MFTARVSAFVHHTHPFLVLPFTFHISHISHVSLTSRASHLSHISHVRLSSAPYYYVSSLRDSASVFFYGIRRLHRRLPICRSNGAFIYQQCHPSWTLRPGNLSYPVLKMFTARVSAFIHHTHPFVVLPFTFLVSPFSFHISHVLPFTFHISHL